MAEAISKSGVGHMSVVYTNAEAVVIYVDSNFSQMLKFLPNTNPIGKPFQSALGIDDTAAQSIIEDVKQAGSLLPRPLKIRTASGSELDITCSGRIARDNRGNFIGMNLELYEQGIEVTPASQIPDEPAILFRYFTQRLIVTIVLVTRIMGVKLRDRIEAVLNQAAAKNGWALFINNGAVDTSGTLDAEAYKGLLNIAEDFARDIIGRPIVEHEISQLDLSMDMSVTRIASKYGLRD